jgi:hypothetical protein
MTFVAANLRSRVGICGSGMQQHDVGALDFKMEEDHCNSLRSTFLANVHPSLRKVDVETTITKVCKESLLPCHEVSIV